VKRGQVWRLQTVNRERTGIVVLDDVFIPHLRGIQVVPIKDPGEVPETVLSVRVDSPVTGIAAVYDVGPFSPKRFIEHIGDVEQSVLDHVEIALRLLFGIRD